MADTPRTDGPRIKSMSEEGVRWLVRLEGGCKLKAYRDSRGIPTIGVGQITIVAQGGERRVTMADRFYGMAAALQSFRKRLKRDEAAIDAATRDDITQAEFDAFCSARYNIGPAFDRSDCLGLFNRRAPIDAVAMSLRANWHRAGETPHALDERRQCEADLLLYGCYRAQGQARAEA